MVIDDSPCVSFNADDSSPILDPAGTILGYATVHSNGYDAAGLSVMRLDLVTINVDGAFYYFASNSPTATSTANDTTTTNVRATLGTALPDACPATRPAARMYGTGLAVDCKKRRASLDVSVPTSLFNCTAGTTEDFNLVFFLQIELDMAPAPCAPSPQPLYAGSIYNAMPAGSGCTFVMVTAACKPSTCTIDRTALTEQQLLTAALGSTGRIDGRSQLLAAAAAAGGGGAFGVSGLTVALLGGIVGGIITAAAVAVLYVLVKRGGGEGGSRGRGAAARARRGARGRSGGVAAEYYFGGGDRPEESSFAIDAVAGGAATANGLRASAGRDARRAAAGVAGGGSRLSISGQLTRISELRLPGAGRWRDKFGNDSGAAKETSPTGGGGGGNQLIPAAGVGAFPISSGAAIPGDGGGGGGSTTAAGRRRSGGRLGSTIFSSGARLPSVFFSSRTGTFWAQPNFVPSDGLPDLAPIRPQLSIAAPRRVDGDAGGGSTLVGAAAAVPMVVGRAIDGTAGGGAAGAAGGTTQLDELTPPENASNVFLNPLALLRGSGGAASRLGTASARAASRLSSVALVSFTGGGGDGGGGNRPSSALAAGERPSRPTPPMTIDEGTTTASAGEGKRPSTEGGWRRATAAVTAALRDQPAGKKPLEEISPEGNRPRQRPLSADADPATPLISRRAGGVPSSSSSSPTPSLGPIAEGLLAARVAEGLLAARVAAGSPLGGDGPGQGVRPWALEPLPTGPTSAMAAMATAAAGAEEEERAAAPRRPPAWEGRAAAAPSAAAATSSRITGVGGGGVGGDVNVRPVPLVLPPPLLPPLGLAASTSPSTPSRLSRMHGAEGRRSQAGAPYGSSLDSRASPPPGPPAGRFDLRPM